MSSVTTIADATAVLAGIKEAVESHIGLVSDIKSWADEQLGALATGGLSEGEMGQAVELFKARMEGLEGGFSEMNHAVQGALQVADLVAQH